MFMSLFRRKTKAKLCFTATILKIPPLPYRPRIRNLAIKALREFLHVSDNSQKDLKENKDNKLYQIEPVLDHVRKNCLEVEPEQDHSIDEQIIPAKPKYSGIRRYNPKKPVKWGFKNFVRSGASGIMYDFFVDTGAASKDETRFSCFRDSKIRSNKAMSPFIRKGFEETARQFRLSNRYEFGSCYSEMA